MAEYSLPYFGRFLAGWTPVLVAILTVMIVDLPISVTGGLLPVPQLALIPVYYWVLLRPDLMSPLAVLGIGLFQDLLSGGPPGLWAAGYLAAYAFADRQRDTLAGLAGIGAVSGFVAAMCIAAATAYVLAMIVFWGPVPSTPLLLQCMVTIIFYPLMAWIMGFIYHGFVGPMRRDD
jgi:rod shape-determining protein MreD